MPRITIGSTVIDFPNTGSDSTWSPAVIQFAEEVADQLSGLAGAFDVNPKVQTLDNDANVNLAISSANFPGTSVRSFIFTYGLYRTNGVDNLAESGTVTGVFNTGDSSWELQHEFVGPRQASGIPYTAFEMSGDELTISTVAIGGSYDSSNSRISYSAKTQLVTA